MSDMPSDLVMATPSEREEQRPGVLDHLSDAARAMQGKFRSLAASEDEGDDRAIVAEAAAYLRTNFGCKTIFTLSGGATALERDPQYGYLLGMTPDRRSALPARLSERVFQPPLELTRQRGHERQRG